MRARTIDGNAERTWALVFDTGDEVVRTLLEFATRQQLRAAHFTAIGAFSDATLGYFDWTS
jgi:predicted DNA-binding protein with PD1-like motif